MLQAQLTKTDIRPYRHKQTWRPHWQKQTQRPYWETQTQRPCWQKQTQRPYWQKQTQKPFWQKQTGRPYWQKQTWRLYWQKQTCKSLSLNFWSCLLKIGVWKSQKHNHECCHFVPSSLCPIYHELGWNVWEKSNTSQTNLFLIFTGKEWINMGVPQGAPFWSETATSFV